MRRTSILLSCVATLVLSAACAGVDVGDPAPDSGQPSDDGGARDASGTDDAGDLPDGGNEDAGEQPDAGLPDGEDGGDEEDGGLVEADGGDTDPPRPLRFLALGDMGKGNDAQYAVAAGMKAACDGFGGCDFVISVGDNIYDSGAASVEDPIFRTHFEEPYAYVDLPFYMSLGNHDYGSGGMGLEFDRGNVQVAYTAHSTRWRMPAPYYAFTEGPVDLFALDTNSIFITEFSSSLSKWALEQFLIRKQEQIDAVVGWQATATRPWRIAYGHHPYLSNGRHGNAGNYDGLGGIIKLPGRGEEMKKFVENHLCGKVDVFIAGHDHNMQDLGRVCGTEFVVSGGGASTTKLEGKNFTHHQYDDSGFLMVEAEPERLTFIFFDAEANERHRRTITR